MRVRKLYDLQNLRTTKYAETSCLHELHGDKRNLELME
jgi:hypothetical protein